MASPKHEGPKVVYKKMGDIEMYGVSADELKRLERSPGSDTLTFATASLGACLGIVVALLGGTFSDKWFIVLVVLAAVMGLQGLKWLVTGLRDKRSNKELCDEIRARHLPEEKRELPPAEKKEPTP